MSSHHYPPSQQFPPTAYSPYPPQSPNPDAFHYQPPPFQQPLGPTFTQQAPGSSPQTIPDPPTARLQQPPINAQPLTLNVQNVGLPNPGMLITDFHTGATLYHVESPKRSHFSSDPHFTFKSPLTNNGIVGSVRFHSMTADIDVLVHGQKVDFKNSIWSSAHELKSKVPGVGKLTWKSHHVLNGGDMRCTDERKQVVARMEAKRWKEVQKEAHFELSPSIVSNSATVDEVIMSGIAVIEHYRRFNGNGNGTGAEVGGEVFGGVGQGIGAAFGGS